MPFHWNIADQLARRSGLETAAIRALAAPDTIPAMIDSLFDYRRFIETVGKDTLATFPGDLPDPDSVAIIGAGTAGLCAAYELLRAGVQPVIFEASSRLGGRAWSRPLARGGFAEMGAMRFPSTALLLHYMNRFGLRFGGQFPNPGQSRTGIGFQNTYYDWLPGQPPPGPFERLRDDWLGFVDRLGVVKLIEAFRGPSPDWHVARKLWQQLVDKYATTSFVDAIREGIPTWGSQDFIAFGALGIGTGGFGPLFANNFIEFLRLIVNGLESHQQLLLNGITALSERFHTAPVPRAAGGERSLASLDAVKFNAPVRAIEHVGGPKSIRLKFDGGLPDRTFRAVIVTASSRAMQWMGLTLPAVPPLIEAPVQESLRSLHMVDSSKLFIRTRTKFWLEDTTLPTNIQTDELPRGLYCLDYEELTDEGVVLISYTWGDDSTKLLAVSPRDRFQRFREVLHRLHPRFAAALEPVDGDIHAVDWQLEPFHNGAFKLHYPSQDAILQPAYFQFLSALEPERDRGIYLAGDSISWAGGWVESALQTGLNAACATAHHLGGKLHCDSPMDQKPDLFCYDRKPDSALRGIDTKM